jgi:hypothetical protein
MHNILTLRAIKNGSKNRPGYSNWEKLPEIPGMVLVFMNYLRVAVSIPVVRRR